MLYLLVLVQDFQNLWEFREKMQMAYFQQMNI